MGGKRCGNSVALYSRARAGKEKGLVLYFLSLYELRRDCYFFFPLRGGVVIGPRVNRGYNYAMVKIFAMEVVEERRFVFVGCAVTIMKEYL